MFIVRSSLVAKQNVCVCVCVYVCVCVSMSLTHSEIDRERKRAYYPSLFLEGFVFVGD